MQEIHQLYLVYRGSSTDADGDQLEVNKKSYPVAIRAISNSLHSRNAPPDIHRVRYS